jgi:hypothetical protein
MFFFDFALMTIVGAGVVAAGIGAVALVGGLVNRHRPAVEGDCRDTAWVLHGEGRRDC